MSKKREVFAKNTKITIYNGNEIMEYIKEYDVNGCLN